MTYLAWTFWGANVAYCAVLTLHTFRPSTWSIATFEPMGNHIKLVFPWQLLGCGIVFFFKVSPWHLLWWWIPGVPIAVFLWSLAASPALGKGYMFSPGRIRSGSRFISSVLTGDFDESPVGRQFAAWFTEHPERSIQRDLFVKLTIGVGGPKGIVAERVIDSMMKVSGGGGAQFGDLLANQLDQIVVFSPPSTDEQAASQRVAKDTLNELKARLRALDGDAS